MLTNDKTVCFQSACQLYSMYIHSIAAELKKRLSDKLKGCLFSLNVDEPPKTWKKKNISNASALMITVIQMT